LIERSSDLNITVAGRGGTIRPAGRIARCPFRGISPRRVRITSMAASLVRLLKDQPLKAGLRHCTVPVPCGLVYDVSGP